MESEIEVQQPRPLGRPCLCCTHPQRREIEDRLLSRDDSISSLSTHFDISIASLKRHRAHHMLVSPGDFTDAGMGPVDILLRITQISDGLAEAAQVAEASGKTGDYIRASMANFKVLESLLDRGITHEALAQRIEMEHSVVQAVLLVARRAPRVRAVIAHQLELMGRPWLADDVRNLIPEPTRPEVES